MEEPTKDYSDLLKAELLTELQQRDQELIVEQEENLNLQKQLSTAIGERSKLEDQLAQCLGKSRSLSLIQDDTRRIYKPFNAELLIESVIDLPEDQVKLLPSMTRTTDKGVKAYVSFLHGVYHGTGNNDDVDDKVGDGDYEFQQK